MRSPRRLGNLARWVARGFLPNQRLRWTREGRTYILVWLGLLGAGLYQQNNLLLLTAGLAAGPIAASVLVSAAMVRRVRVTRRAPTYVFAGDALTLDYTLMNDQRRTAALALDVEDDLAPVDRAIPGAARRTPRVVFARVPAKGRRRVRWEATAPVRGRYQFEAVDLITRAPFGLLERRLTVASPDDLIVYPTVGQLSRRWQQAHREATESRRGRRHDRTARQQEYHGLRDYRPGDNLRSIHWRTSARVGQLMVKEFEQQNDQDLAVLVDPWLPRSKVTAEQREALEAVVRFAATVCLETCRHSGRRLLLGWTGASPGIRQGPASVRVLHELLEVLATMRPATEGGLAALLDVVPPSALRDSFLVVVSTRPIQWMEETERSTRLSGPTGRGLAGRVLVLDASKGDLDDMVRYDVRTSAATGILREPKRDGGPRP
ncbi:MAG: DUF58 domain-containing protein [Isosphaeraceae bacterium]